MRPNGTLGKPVVVESAAVLNQQWLMDVFLDSMVDFELSPQIDVSSALPSGFAASIQGPELRDRHLLSIGRQNVENLLKEILEDDGVKLLLRFRNAGAGRLAIKLSNGMIIPALRNLSAGQSVLFNLFATVIRYADRDDINKSFKLNQIEGIVVIDEIDAHLHVDLQFRVLPRLLKLFPKVQFVLTSHSPLFLLGLENEFGSDGVQIIEMPSGRAIGTERFREFKRSFDVYRTTKSFEVEVEQQLMQATKPLVLTEGQTDPAYIKTALEVLGHEDLLNLLEIEQIGTSTTSGTAGGGASHLNKAATFLQHNQNRFNRSVLLLFDCDVNKPSVDDGRVFQRSLRANNSNSRVTRGIENLLPESVFEDCFYEVVETSLPDGGSKVFKTLKKQELCDSICGRRDPDAFANFESHVIPLLQEFIERSIATPVP